MNAFELISEYCSDRHTCTVQYNNGDREFCPFFDSLTNDCMFCKMPFYWDKELTQEMTDAVKEIAKEYSKGSDHSV